MPSLGEITSVASPRKACGGSVPPSRRRGAVIIAASSSTHIRNLHARCAADGPQAGSHKVRRWAGTDTDLTGHSPPKARPTTAQRGTDGRNTRHDRLDRAPKQGPGRGSSGGRRRGQKGNSRGLADSRAGFPGDPSGLLTARGSAGGGNGSTVPGSRCGGTAVAWGIGPRGP